MRSTLIYDIMNAFYIACTTFMAQNYGAGNRERVMKSLQNLPYLLFLHRVCNGSATAFLRHELPYAVYTRA